MTAVLLLLAVGAETGGSRPPLAAEIDRLVAAGDGFPKSPAAPATDAEFVRRAYLDLAGTIPTAAEARAFLADKDAGKRAKLIDALLAGPDYADRMGRAFDVLFLDRRKAVRVPDADWKEFLRSSFAANKPYDQLVRAVLRADGGDPKTRPAARFWLDRDPQLDPYQLTRDISRLFLGRNVQCAQCHDHPVVDDYTQAEFYGLFAFLNRTSLFVPGRKAQADAVLAEKPDGEVTFQSVFDKTKTTYTAVPRVLNGPKLTEPKPEKGKEYKVAPAKGVQGVPAFSRRAALADAVVSSPAFARAAVNRFWFLMTGRGLVHPLDLDHADNPPSHPELLDLLAKEFAGHNFDVKWLLREIALSQTYQRSGEVPAGLKEPPAPETFAVALLKPLSPEQLAFAALRATGTEDAWAVELGKKFTPEAVRSRRAGQVGPFAAAFAPPPGVPEPAEFEATLDHALFFANGPAVRGLLAPRPGSLTDRLAKLPGAAAVADELFLTVLTRRPAPEEAAAVADFLAATPDRPAAVRELASALLATAEFRFNH